MSFIIALLLLVGSWLVVGTVCGIISAGAEILIRGETETDSTDFWMHVTFGYFSILVMLITVGIVLYDKFNLERFFTAIGNLPNYIFDPIIKRRRKKND